MQKKFKAVIEEGRGGGAFVTVPFDVEQVFGDKRPKIKATIDGEPYRGLLVRMGGPCHILGVLKGIREKIGKGIGDTVSVVVEPDVEPREITVPDDLARGLQENAAARAFFETLSFTHRKEYVVWIESAKKPETRNQRLTATLELLQQKRKAR